jgi:hypothetical protein
VIDPHGVDREAHEEGVDRRRRAKKKSLAGFQLASTEEALEPRERCLRQKTPLTHRPTVLTLQAWLH